jgi:prepilin-type N-terminal cleavage/methylation domain-containing protein/prepilin-type processing-associated H-X9-DG protein
VVSRSAFTLIELLAVIAIILILLTLMFPSVFLINARASRFTCFNNIKNLQTGVLLYAADNSGSFPSSMTEANHCSTAITNSWAFTRDYKEGVVWPYLNSPATYMCPGYPKTPSSIRFKRHYTISAFINGTTCEAGHHGAHYPAKGFSEVKSLQKTMCLVEEYYNGQYREGDGPGSLHAYCVGLAPRNPGRMIDPPPIWHDRGGNYSFMDGHAEYKKWEGSLMVSYDLDTWVSSTVPWGGSAADNRDREWLWGTTTNGYIYWP